MSFILHLTLLLLLLLLPLPADGDAPVPLPQVRRSAPEQKLFAVPVLTSQRHSVPTVESSAPTTRGMKYNIPPAHNQSAAPTLVPTLAPTH